MSGLIAAPQPQLAALEAARETPQSAYVKEEVGAISEQNEHNAVIEVLKKRLKEKIKACTTLQQLVRATTAKESVLKQELATERQTKGQLDKDVTEEKSKNLDLRRRHTLKGKEHVRNLKRIHELENRLKGVTYKANSVADSEKYAQTVARSVQDKLRSAEREITAQKFRQHNTQTALDTQLASTQTLKDELQRKQYAIARENYANRMEIENLKRVVDEKTEVVKELTVETRAADQEVQRLTMTLEAINQEAGRMKDSLTAKCKQSAFHVQGIDAEVKQHLKNVTVMESEKESGLTREKLLQKQIETTTLTEIALTTSCNECKAQVAILHGRLKDAATEHTTLLQESQDSKAELQLLREKLENVEYVFRDTSTQLQRETAHAKRLGEELKEEIEQEKDHTDALGAAKAYAKKVETQVALHTDAEGKARGLLNAATTRVAIIKKDIEMVEASQGEMKAMIEDKLAEGEQIAKALEEKRSEYQYFHAQAIEKQAELEADLDAKTSIIQRLERAIELVKAKNENMLAMQQQSAEQLAEEKKALEKKINDVQANDATLRGRINDQQEQHYALRLQLESEMDRSAVLDAKFGALEKEIAPIKHEMDKELVQLESAVTRKSQQVFEFETQVEYIRKQQRSTQKKYDAEVEVNRAMMKKLRAEQMKSAAVNDRLVEVTKLQKDDLQRIEALEDALADLEAQLSKRTDECEELHTKINEASNRTNFQNQMIRDEELTRAKISQALSMEREALHGLDRLIKMKEGQFETDAAQVAERILILQTALVEKEENARRVAGELTASRESAARLKLKLEEVHELSEAEREEYEEALKVEKSAVELLTKSCGENKVAAFTLTAEIKRIQEQQNDLRIKLEGHKNESEVLLDDAEMSRKEAKQLELTLQTRGAYEKELLDSLEVKDQTITLLKTQVSAKEAVETSLQKQLRTVEYDLKQLKDRMTEKVNIEEALVQELEVAKMKFSTVAPSDPDVALQTGMKRAEAHRAEYANTLLKMLKAPQP